MCVVPILFAASVEKKKKKDDERGSRPAKQHIFFSCIGVNTTVAHIYTQAHPRQMEMEPRFHCCSNDVMMKYIWCKWRRECSVTWLWVPVGDEDDTAPGDKQAGCHVVVQNCRPRCQRQGSREWASWQSIPLDRIKNWPTDEEMGWRQDQPALG